MAAPVLDRRAANAAGFAACAALTAYALYQQYVVGLEPCHLCILQRVGILALGVVFLLAVLQNPRDTGAKVYAALVALVAGATAITAGRHIWIQNQPAGSVPACGADLDFMMDIMPLHEVLISVFRGGGECQKVDWTFLGLSMPVWVLFAAVALGAFGVWANLRAHGASRRSSTRT